LSVNIKNGSYWALVLAAGESKRMGFPKMLLTFNGKTMLENVISNIESSYINNIMVVLGAEQKAIQEVVSKTSAKSCYNVNYKDGMLSSVKCGIRNVPSDSEAVLVFQGDQPLIESDIINDLINAYRSSNKGIVIPVYQKKRGHPLLICNKYITEIEKLDAHDGLRSLAFQFSDDVLEIETTSPGILRDFDTYEEYKKEINQI
jgi:molybdenum cofactor cytidylyltransferase